MSSLTIKNGKLLIEDQTLATNSGCCCLPCGCKSGILPDMITVTFEGSGSKPGPSLLSLNITSCFGTGAAGIIGGDGEYPAPISTAAITSGGSGYAILGRAPPSLLFCNQAEINADVTILTTLKTDNCNRPYYAVSGISVINSGYGYSDNELVYIGRDPADIEEVPAVIRIRTGRVQPTMVAVHFDQGSGAEFILDVIENNDNTWSVGSVTVAGEPSGYVSQILYFDTLDNAGVEIQSGFGEIKVERSEPTIDIFETHTGLGSGATLSAVLFSEGSGSNEVWKVQSASVINSGNGYGIGDYILMGSSDVTIQYAYALVTAIGQDSIALYAQQTDAGEGAIFNVNFNSNNDDPETYSITSVSFSGEPIGYVTQTLNIVDINGYTPNANEYAEIRLDVDRFEPIFDVWIAPGETGQNASVAVIATSSGIGDQEIWSISNISIVDGGTGYNEGNYVAIYITNGVTVNAAAGYISSVDENGSILSISLYDDNGGQYYGTDGIISNIVVINGGSYLPPNTGPVESVEIDYPWDAGEFYATTGLISEVVVIQSGKYYQPNSGVAGIVVANSGRYYRPDPSLPAVVSDITTTISQGYPSNGSGAVISPIVDTNTSSPSFGQITDLTITSGGSNYLAWRRIYSDSCEWIYREPSSPTHSIICYRFSPWSCDYYGFKCFSGTNNCRVEDGSSNRLYLVVSSLFKTTLYPVAIYGASDIPNGSGAPICGLVYDEVSDDETPGCTQPLYNHMLCYNYIDPSEKAFPVSKWAYPGRVQIVPDKLVICENEYETTCTMTQQSLMDLLPYWQVSSVSIPENISGVRSGECITIQGYYEDDCIGEYCFGDSFNLPGRKNATGSAIVDESGVLIGINIIDGGIFYRQVHHDVEPPIAPEPSGYIFQLAPSFGSGAQFDLSINTDTYSEDFGNLGVNLISGGDGYISNIAGAVGFLNGEYISVNYLGNKKPPIITQTNVRQPLDYLIELEQLGGHPPPPIGGVRYIKDNIVYTTDTLISDCNNLSFEAQFGEATATVEPGGDLKNVFVGSRKCCGQCYNTCPDIVDLSQITVTLTREESSGFTVLASDNTGPFAPYIVEQDSLEINCPADQQEIIIDIDDLEEQKFCQYYNITTPYLSSVETTNTLHLASGISYGNLGSSEVGDMLVSRPSGELVRANINIKIYSSNTLVFEEPTPGTLISSPLLGTLTPSQLLIVNIDEEWIGRGYYGTSASAAINRDYWVNPASGLCGSFPDSWDNNIYNNAGFVDVGGLYDTVINLGGPEPICCLGLGPRLYAVRRVCNPYQVEVEFS